MTGRHDALVATLLTTFAVFLSGCGGSDDGAGNGPNGGSTARSPDTEQDAAASGSPSDIRLVQVGQFDQPVHAVPVPGTDHVAVVEKGGRVIVAAGLRCVDASRCPEQPVDDGTVAVDLSDAVSTGSEQGLLGLAFHPQWPEDERIFLNYTDRAGNTRIESWRLPSATATATRIQELMRIMQPYVNHNGGHLVFGPDGLLYVGVGDGGGAGDPRDRAQQADELLGKLLRLDVDGGGERGYAIPDGNLREGAPEAWAVGMRNPWRFSFDSETGDLWIGDVGQNEWEEIDALPADRLDSGATPNFGWSLYEGYEEFEPEIAKGPGELEFPVLAYGRDEGCSVTGGVVYRGELVPALQGHYVFADYCGEDLRLVESGDLPKAGAERGEVTWSSVDGTGQIVSFAPIQNGELLVVSLQGGIFQVVPA